MISVWKCLLSKISNLIMLKNLNFAEIIKRNTTIDCYKHDRDLI